MTLILVFSRLAVYNDLQVREAANQIQPLNNLRKCKTKLRVALVSFDFR